jgi:bla regulator protein blaR1
MSELSQLLLTFLLNACWQIALVAMAAALCGWLLRGTAARRRHLLWVIALVSSFCLPLLASSRLLEGKSSDQARAQVTTQRANADSFSPAQLIPEAIQAARPAPLRQANSFVPVSRNMAALVVVFYLLLLGFRGGKLFLAWRRTKAIASSAYPVDLPAKVQTVIGECQAALGISRAQIMCSTSVPAPITVGIRDPLVILPEQLLQEADRDVLTSAIGHELVHVLRRDYLLNLLYELIALPLAFHPATALLKRRIRETRELGCDELVTDRLLEPAAYAPSLVQLAGAAITAGRPTATITVGIADADILEERVMTILNRPKISLRRKNLLFAAAALVFIGSCVVSEFPRF